MDILIFAGQSNMQGSTGKKGSSIAKNCLEYKFLTDSIVELKDPVGEDIGDGLLFAPANGCGTLVPAFCNAYAKKKGSCLAIHCARGGTSIAQWKFGSDRYNALIEKARRGIVRARENFEESKIYFVWLQGESDAVNKTNGEVYYNALIELKNALKKDLHIDKFCIIKVGYFARFVKWSGSGDVSNDEIIMDAQERVVKDDNDFVMLTRICSKLSTKKRHLNLLENGPHYNNHALDIIGKKAGKTLAKLK